MTIRLLVELGGYPVGAVLDGVGILADVLCAMGCAEPILTEPTITVHEDGHRDFDIHVTDSITLVDR